MISPGQKIDTRLRLAVVRDGEAIETTLGALLERPTIVSVYMRNNTGSCDRQIKSLVAGADALAALGYGLVAVSRDSPASHVKYAKKLGVRFPLVSDPDDLFSKAAGAIVEKSMYGRTFLGPVRAAYVLERDGTVRAVVGKVDTADHASQLRAVVSG